MTSSQKRRLFLRDVGSPNAQSQIAIDDPYSTFVPEGDYDVALTRCETGVAFGSERWFGHFKIVDHGEFFGLPIYRFWNRPKSKVLARSSNVAIDFMNVVGRRPPSVGLTPDKFLKGCQVLAEVVTVKHRNEPRCRVELPEDCWYSKINRIIRLSAGTPPCL
jgi:hypothetical protein